MADKKQPSEHTIIFKIKDDIHSIKLEAKIISFDHNYMTDRLYFYNENDDLMLAINSEDVILHYDSKRHNIENF